MTEEQIETPALTTEQMVEVDRLMIEEYGITLIQMMENAGRNLAELARRILGGRFGVGKSQSCVEVATMAAAEWLPRAI